MRWQKNETNAIIPMRVIGPIKINGIGEVKVPLATFETPLWPSTHRGARVSFHAGGINAVMIQDCMTRSLLFEVANVMDAQHTLLQLKAQKETMQQIVSQISRFTRLIDFHTQVVGNLIFIRFEFNTGDAAGHNMATLAAERLQEWILTTFPKLYYVSISGNYCTDKKVSAVNGILGRGKYVVADIQISEEICHTFLRTTPEKIVSLNTKKNLIGNIVAGGLRTANAHFANMLLGFYLATGQDAANIVEGSQGLVHAEVRGSYLYFSVTLPNLIVGTVGNGKNYDFVKENLALLGCNESRDVGENAKRLALIAAATVLCGELSLLAAQTNPGELMKSHIKLERSKKKEEVM